MICDNCIKKDVCIYRDNSEICGEDYHEFVTDFNVLEQIKTEIEQLTTYEDIWLEYKGHTKTICKSEVLDIIDKYTKGGKE